MSTSKDGEIHIEDYTQEQHRIVKIIFEDSRKLSLVGERQELNLQSSSITTVKGLHVKLRIPNGT